MMTQIIRRTINPRLHCDIDEIFAQYGLPKGSNDTFRCKCPIHGGDKYSFSYNGRSQTWKCFSQHCDEEHGNKLSDLLYALTGDDYSHINCRRSGGEYIPRSPIYRNTPLQESYKPYPYIPYLINRGFFSHTCAKFEAFVCDDKWHELYNRVVLPVRDHNGVVVGMSGRSQQTLTKLKWCHYGFRSGEVIYNFHNIKEYDTIILVEGPFDVWRAHEAGIHNCGALFGTSISLHQLQLIKESGFRSVILCMDPDKAGGHATIKKGGLLDKLSEICDVYSVRHALRDDLGDMSVQEIRNTVCPEIMKIYEQQV